MKNRYRVAASLLLIAAGLCLFLNFNKPAPAPAGFFPPDTFAAPSGGTPGSSSPGTISNSPEITSSNFQAQPGSLAAAAGQFVPDSSPPVELPPETVLQNVRRAIRQYGEMFGGNPVGTNPEITSQLSGENPRHINFIAAQEGMHIDAAGDLVDAWGTPYFFHQISGTETEIHSAGPDKIMWTSDDLVVK